MIGLHPTSVNDSYGEEISIVIEKLKSANDFVAIGEVGMDLYWDKTYLNQQLAVFERQVQLAIDYQLPIIIHCREAFDYIYKVLLKYKEHPLSGIFHSFSGTPEEVDKVMAFKHFMFGINGTITFKKSTFPETLRHIPLERIVLETDSPYLAPVPNRGKRNESAFLRATLVKVADIYQLSPEEVAYQTSQNSLKVFGMLK